MRRAVIVILALALLAAGCSYRGDDGPEACSGVTLWGDLSLTDALVEVEGIVATGREVASEASSATYPVSSGVVTRVLYADPAIADGIVVGETLEFTRTVDPAETGGPVLLFLVDPLEEAGIPQLAFRIAAVEEADGLRFLGDRAWCWADDFSEFVKEIDWSLVEAHDDLPDGSDDLQLMTAWVQEIIDTIRPRRNGPITRAWLGEVGAFPVPAMITVSPAWDQGVITGTGAPGGGV
ncbi:MAG: hypothetical protein KJ698_04960 [Actinobacteria bacterium]|nr:hypothetical protein [Actinomycetota bacterium]MBU1492716.1 hypothetical protein [Actinomycetota bacterium]